MTDNTSTTNTAAQIIDEFIQCADANRPHGKLIAQAKDWLAAHYATLTQQQGEQEALDGVTEAMAECALEALDAACKQFAKRHNGMRKVVSWSGYETTDRLAVVRAALTAALRTKQPAASEGDGTRVEPKLQRWTMTKGSDGARWSVYMDHADAGEWVKWEHVRLAWFHDMLARDLAAKAANTSKQAAGEAVAFALLPEMTDPMGRYWKQPAGLRDRVRVFAEHVTIDERDWLALSKYETTNPSGAYTGKVWRRGEFLCWYGAVSGDRIAIESKCADVQTSDTTPPRHPADEPHRNAGDSEANFIADGDRLNCPACGGSGHVDDAKAAEPVDLHKALGRVRARANEPGTVAQHGRAYADGLRSACNMLEGMPIVKSVFKAAPPTEQAPAFKGGHCVHRQQPGGCPLHNLHCRYPDCDLQPIEAPTEPLQLLPCPKR